MQLHLLEFYQPHVGHALSFFDTAAGKTSFGKEVIVIVLKAEELAFLYQLQ